jgi:PBP1b-binding outer membrane lipoprotein LpoB
MKKILPIILILLFLSGCASLEKGEASTYDAKEQIKEQIVHLNYLAKNEEFIQKVDEKLVFRLDGMASLLDELELAIQKEKIEEYNKGVVDGKKAAIDELIQNGYVVLKIEDLKKYGLWEEEE